MTDPPDGALNSNITIFEFEESSLDEFEINVSLLSGFLTITENTVLQSLEGLENLVNIEDDVVITENDAFTTLDGLTSGTCDDNPTVQLGGNLIISSNPGTVT